MGRKKDPEAEIYQGFISRLDRRYTNIDYTSDAELANTIIFEFFMRTDDFENLYSQYRAKSIMLPKKKIEWFKSDQVQEVSFEDYLFDGLDTFEQFGYSTSDIKRYIQKNLAVEEDEKVKKSVEEVEKAQKHVQTYNELQAEIILLDAQKKSYSKSIIEFSQKQWTQEYEKYDIEMELDRLNKEHAKILKAIEQLKADQTQERNQIDTHFVIIQVQGSRISAEPKYTFNPYRETLFGINGIVQDDKANFVHIRDAASKEEDNELKTFFEYWKKGVQPEGLQTNDFDHLSVIEYKFSKPKYYIPKKYQYAITVNMLYDTKELETQCKEIIAYLKKKHVDNKVVTLNFADFFGFTQSKIIDNSTLENMDMSSLSIQNAFANYFYFYDMIKKGIKKSALEKYMKNLVAPDKKIKFISDVVTIEDKYDQIKKLLDERRFINFVLKLEDTKRHEPF